MLKTFINDDCTYAIDNKNNLLYISLSFENLSDLKNCSDYMIINIKEYLKENKNDVITELIMKVSDK